MEKRTKYFPNKEAAVCENCPFPLYSPPQGKNANNSFDPKSNTLLLDVIGNSLKKNRHKMFHKGCALKSILTRAVLQLSDSKHIYWFCALLAIPTISLGEMNIYLSLKITYTVFVLVRWTLGSNIQSYIFHVHR